jgi:hypothetical protein
MGDEEKTTTFDDLPDPALRQIFCRNFQCSSFQTTERGSLNTEFTQICKRFKCLYGVLDKTELSKGQIDNFVLTLLARHFDPLLLKHEQVAKPFNSTLWVVIAKYRKNNESQVECVNGRIIPYGIRACATQFHLYKPTENTDDSTYQDTVRPPKMNRINVSFNISDQGRTEMYQKLTRDIASYVPCSLNENEHLRVALQFFVQSEMSRTRPYREANNMKHLFNSGSMLALKDSKEAFNKIIWEYVKNNFAPPPQTELAPPPLDVIPNKIRKYTNIHNYYESEQGGRLNDPNNTTPLQPLFDYILNYAENYDELVVRNVSNSNGGSRRKTKGRPFKK